jgi:hypothetical protein
MTCAAASPRAGCVPLLLRSWYLLNKNGQTFYTALPFASFVPWDELTLRLVPAYSSAACIDGDARCPPKAPPNVHRAAAAPATNTLTNWRALGRRRARWISAWHNRSLEAVRRKGHAAFRRYMDYGSNPTGVASAMLAEVAARKRLGAHDSQPGGQEASTQDARKKPHQRRFFGLSGQA